MMKSKVTGQGPGWCALTTQGAAVSGHFTEEQSRCLASESL